MLVFSPPVKEDSFMPMLNAGLGAISGWLRQNDYSFDQKSLLAECRYRNRYRFKEDHVDLSVFEREEVIEYLRGEEKPAISREANKLGDILNIDSYDKVLASVKSDVSLMICLPILKERCSDKLTVIGGPLTLSNDLEIVKLPFVDYGVRGDGEIPIKKILEKEMEGKEISNEIGLVYDTEDGLVKRDPCKYPMERKADMELHVKNFTSQKPLTFVRRQLSKLYKKNYDSYIWLYS